MQGGLVEVTDELLAAFPDVAQAIRAFNPDGDDAIDMDDDGGDFIVMADLTARSVLHCQAWLIAYASGRLA